MGLAIDGDGKFFVSDWAPRYLGPMPAGGLALLRIQLLPDVGKPKNAFLQVNCAIGKVPENQQGDGIRLAVQGEELKFDQKVNGRTLFMLRKPGFNLGLQSTN